MDRWTLLENAAKWMKMRGWKRKLGKVREREQTLFEHSLIEFDVLLELLPILSTPRHYGLSSTEQEVLMVAVLVHDVGKETDAWQAYVSDPSPERWVPHILPELTGAVIPEICVALQLPDLSQPVQQIMAYCANFHHSRPGKNDGAILGAMLVGGTDRFLTLANLVRGIDHFCSAGTLHQAVEVADSDSSLGCHLLVTTHEVMVRGVSTSFLHRAAQSAFQAKGWRPLLYYPEGTVYGADPNEDPKVPSWEDIRSFLKSEIDTAIARDVTALMVGSPTGNILPKPDLLSYSEVRLYLRIAAQKVRSESFARKPLKDKRKVVEKYLQLKGDTSLPTDAEVEEYARRISVAQPEMMVFKIFKAIMDPSRVESLGDDGAALAECLYETVFGKGSWKELQSTSTLMPACDMAKTIDRFWSLPGASVGHPEVKAVDELPNEVRLSTLIELLGQIAETVYKSIGRPSPRDQVSMAMAETFMRDLVKPSVRKDIREFVQDQLNHYINSKYFAGKDSSKGSYLCPICNRPFSHDEGVKASADFIANPQSHTNRGIAHGSFEYVMVCVGCYYECLLRQVLLGQRPEEIITVLPRFNLGPGRGEQFLKQVREWVETAQAYMRGDKGSPETGFSLGMTDRAATKLGDRDPTELGYEEASHLFTYRLASDTLKQRKKELLKRLKEEFDDDLASLNRMCGQDFKSWEDVATTLIQGRIDNHELMALRREVFRRRETIGIICETPNMVFVPLTYEITGGDKESETSKALRKLFVALILSLVFDASVAIHGNGELMQFWAYSGVAYVPPVPAVRSLIGSDWIGIDQSIRWINAIGAASLLARNANFPVRSSLYEVLSSDPAEKILRRIEEKKDRRLTARHLYLIQKLPGFHSSKEEMRL